VTFDLSNPEVAASLIDHTLLKPEAVRSDIVQLCEEAGAFSFCSVCVNPYWVSVVSQILRGASVRVSTVVGFPLGANDTGAKIAEADRALSQGAQELDMVQNLGALRSQDLDFVREEIAALSRLAHSRGAILKVILETCLLSNEEKITACKLALEAQADFVKTSTGFSTRGATVEDVRLMRKTVGPSMGVKASGGIRTLDALRDMVSAGANRIGTSAGVSILREIEGAHKISAGTPAPRGAY